MSKMRSNSVYNHANNEVMVKTNGDEINIICNTEDQMDRVVKRWGFGIGFVVGFLIAGWASAAGVLTGF